LIEYITVTDRRKRQIMHRSIDRSRVPLNCRL